LVKINRLLIACFGFVLPCCICLQAGETTLKAEASKTEGIPYEIKWPSIEQELLDVLKTQATLIKLEKRPITVRSGLVKRAERDVEQFTKVLAAHGYFAGHVSFVLDEAHSPILVKFKINPGLHYKVSHITLLSPNDVSVMKNQTVALTSDVVGVEVGDYVNLSKIHAGKERIKKYFQHIGYPFVEVSEPEAIINHEKAELQIIYRLQTGLIARIVDTKIDGLTHLCPDFVKNRVLWQSGQKYDQYKIDKTKRKLIETGLLSTVTITPEKSLEPKDGSEEEKVVMRVKASEGAPRAFGVGARFATSEGVGGHLAWDHNNLKRNGEHLGFSLNSSKRETKARAAYDISDFLSPRQKWMNEISAVRERTRAYVGRTYNIGTRIQRPFGDHFKGSVGLIGEVGRIRRENTTYNTHLLGFPGELKLDASDDLLNPTRGARVDGRITPYVGKLNTSPGMTITQGNVSAYLPFMTNEIGESRGVLAGFVKGGSIFIKSLDFVPPNKRFYAGGGGSVRGYGYQMLGPLDSQNIPLGGRSLAEVGTELRIKTTETLGFVTFLEGGSVTASKAPDFRGKNMLWGAGVGFRYYSTVGPIRVDLAFPLKRRRVIGCGKAIDAPFQFYISVGQAF
jgi:translocation and assembly module TamA